jgi:hypothetical protein
MIASLMLLSIATSLVLSAPAGAPSAEDECLAIARMQGGAAAAECYRAVARTRGDALTDSERRTLDALIDAALSLELVPAAARNEAAGARVPTVTAPAAPVAERFEPFDLGALIASGKGELVATSTLAGSAAALLAFVGFAQMTRAQQDPPLVALGILSPLAGGAVGLGASVAGSLFVPSLSPGRAHLIRAFQLLGGFNALMVPTTIATSTSVSNDLGRAAPLLSMSILTASTGVGVGLAFLNLPEETGPMAISGGAWGAVLAAIMMGASDPWDDALGKRLARVILVGGNGGFVLAGVAAQVFPITRLETWAMDAGGLLGGLAAFAIANQLRAPTPQIGWGSTGLGVVGGLATGLLLARSLPSLVDGLALPNLVALGPSLVPDGKGGVGVVATARVPLP